MSANLGDGSENWPLARMYDPQKDGARSYDLGIRAMREVMVRTRQDKPRPDSAQELIWAHEGPRPFHQLDTVRQG